MFYIHIFMKSIKQNSSRNLELKLLGRYMLRWAYNYCNTHYMWNVVAIGLNTPFHSCFCTLYNRFHIFYGLKLGSAASLNNCFRGKCHVRAYANQRICHLLYDYMICILSSTSFFFDLFFMLVMIINTYYIM